MDVFHSVLCHYLKLKHVHKSQRTENILLQDKLLPLFQHGFLRSAENVDLHNLGGVVWENVNLTPHTPYW